MKFINYEYNGKKQLGVVIDNEVTPIDFTSFQDMFDKEIDLKSLNKELNNISERLKLEDVKVLAPIEYPKRNIFCLGKNYYAHAKELEGKTSSLAGIPTEPIYFSKTASPAIGPDDVVTGHVGVTDAVDYEVELAIIIGKAGKNIEKKDAEDYIFGYTICNDLSARDLQTKHTQWHKGKSLDGFCPLGPVVVTKDTFSYPPDLSIKCFVNDELRQEGRTSDLIFDMDYIISDLSKGMTLLPGDIIITGTPAGVGMGFDPPKYLSSGDTVICDIEGIGQLKNIIK